MKYAPNILILLFITTSSFSQVGTQFLNHEETNYDASMKSANFTYLIWDRNHNGSGLFSTTDRPMFMYWDNDNNTLGYLVDTRNMERLKAKFYSTTINTNLFVTNGFIGLGTTTIPSGYKLAVAGKIIADEIKVEASPWPDYVFAPTYNLRSLEETEAFIQANNHLPEMPSAEEVEENGIQLGEMNTLLLKKIEELTLYQIEMMKRIEELEKKKGK